MKGSILPPKHVKRKDIGCKNQLFAAGVVGLALLGQLQFCSRLSDGWRTDAHRLELQRLRDVEGKMYKLESEIQFLIEIGKLQGVDLSAYRNTQDKLATLSYLHGQPHTSDNLSNPVTVSSRLLQPLGSVAHNSTTLQDNSTPPVYGETTSWLVTETSFGWNNVIYDMLPRYAITAGAAYTRWMDSRYREKGGRYWNTTRKTEGSEKIKRIWIWGERNSCTSVITKIIQKNFNLNCGELSAKTESSKNTGFNEVECVIGGLPWKHDFARRADFSKQSSTLNILVTRHPYEWLSSMKKHPFYAELHYNMPSMEAFLRREWVSFKVGKTVPRPRANSKQSPRMTWTGLALPKNHSCSTQKKLFAGETCMMSETQYECTSLLGLDSSLWQHYNNEIALPHCQNAEISSNYCAGGFLCQWENVSRPWSTDFDAWQRHVEKIIHTAPDFDNEGLGAAGKGYTCLPVPGYRNNRGNMLAPSLSCLDGRTSREKCKDGKFFCKNLQKQLWMSQRSVWNSLRRILESSNKHFQSKDVRNLNTRAPPRLSSAELLQDRDPDTQERFPNILAMREAKIMDWMLIADKVYNFSSHVACRDFYLSPEAVLERLESFFGLSRRAQTWDLSQCEMIHGVSLCKDQKGTKTASDWNDETMVKKREFYLSGKFMKDFSQEALDIANAWLNPELEAALGYKLIYDVTVASAPYDAVSRCGLHRPKNASMPADCFHQPKTEPSR